MRRISPCATNAILTLIAALFVSIALLCVLKVTPFGSNSLATMDARIQYLDFFSYFKTVLEGSDGLLYSFTKMLGGNGVADYTYYLSSPLNLLVLFFERSNLNNFFSLLVVLKTTLACVSFSFFIGIRWRKLNSTLNISLSLAYGFSQYSAAQASNIIWLDGVILLPIIMIGVHNVINNNKPAILISSVLLNLLFSWYTAYFNILFLFIYFIFEKIQSNESLKSTLKVLAKLILYVGVSVGCSMFLFLPTLLALSSGKGGIYWYLLQPGFNGNIINTLANYVIGGLSARGSAALYCGSVIIPIITAYLFFSKSRGREKHAITFLLATTILSLYFIPFEFIFNELREVSSYYYRYSYLSSCAMLLISAQYLSSHPERKHIVKSSIIFSIILLTLAFIDKNNSLDNVYFTALISITLSGLLFSSREMGCSNKRIRISYLLLFMILFVSDLSVNYIKVSKGIGLYNAENYKSYVTKNNEVIKYIRSIDNGVYRIVNQNPRFERQNTINPNQNEPSAFGYMGISSYSSSFNSNQVNLLHHLGYADTGPFTNTYTRIISSDSLLSVKYIISEKPIKNLKLIKSINGKLIYENQYFIPFGFTFKGRIDSDSNLELSNPFEFQNQLFSILTGENQKIFSKLEDKVEENNRGVRYTLPPYNKENQAYGYIDTKINTKNHGEIFTNGNYVTAYSSYLSPRVFSVDGDGNKSIVEYKKLKKLDSIKSGNFYVLDYKKLSSISSTLNHMKVNELHIGKSSLTAIATVGDDDHSLFLPFTVDKGWRLSINGKEMHVNNSLWDIASIPLVKGKNLIEMKFTPPGLYIGMVISLISFILGLLIIFKSSFKRVKFYR